MTVGVTDVKMVTAWFLVGTIKLEPNHHDKRKNVVRDYGNKKYS